jgi:hypothetical protein
MKSFSLNLVIEKSSSMSASKPPFQIVSILALDLDLLGHKQDVFFLRLDDRPAPLLDGVGETNAHATCDPPCRLPAAPGEACAYHDAETGETPAPHRGRRARGSESPHELTLSFNASFATITICPAI